MVSSIISDALRDPSKEIQDLKTSQNSANSNFLSEVEKYFKDLLSPHDAFIQIPPLGVSHPPSMHRQRTVVRFMGMVQDTSASPEVYVESLADGSCGGWGLYEQSLRLQDVEHQEHQQIDYSKLKERESIWAVTIPGETRWARNRFNGPDFSNSPKAEIYKCPKPHKNPLEDPDAFGVSLKMYHSRDVLRPGEVKIFMGILDEEAIDEEEEIENQLDSGVAPVIHVLFTLDASVTDPFDLGGLRAALPTPTTVKDELVQWIANESLYGDNDAATWLLLSIISKVQSRSPPILPLSLTLSSFPDAQDGKSSEPAVIHILRRLLPAVTTIPVTLQGLNGKSFNPTSSGEDLHSGCLQQPLSSLIVATEIGITEGRVTEQGLKNLNSLQVAISSQTVSYEFPFSSYTFSTDSPIIVLSKGRKSGFLKTDVVMPIKSDLSTDQFASAVYKSEDEINYPSEEKLNLFRDYIISSQRLKVTLEDDVGKHIEDEFVRRRQDSGEKFSSDDLARRMTVAKLLSASRSEEKLTKETWVASGALGEALNKSWCISFHTIFTEAQARANDLAGTSSLK